jgi:hypothetical protein
MTASLDDYCPACGFRKPPGAESCPDCGERFTAAPQADEEPGEATPPAAPPPRALGPTVAAPAAPAPPAPRKPAPAPAVPAAFSPASAPAVSSQSPLSAAPAAPTPPAPSESPPRPLESAPGAVAAQPGPPRAVPSAAPPAVPGDPAEEAPPPPPDHPAADALPAAPGHPAQHALPAVPVDPADDAPPPGYATVWPPVTAVKRVAPSPSPPAAAPAPAPEAAAPPPARRPPQPPAEPPVDMAPVAPPAAPEPRGPVDRRLLAVGGVVLAIMVAGLVLLLIPHGAKQPERQAALGTPTSTPTARQAPATGLASQVKSLDALMRMSERGRSAAVKGNFAAAVVNRTSLLRKIQRLRARAATPVLRSGLASFAAAVREALRQNRTCKAACPAADLARVGRFKQAALARLNPLLRRYAGTRYRRQQI